MITDAFLIYLLFQLIILMINIIGYSRIPYLCFMGILATIGIGYQTIIAFDEYWGFALILILINIVFPVLGITKAGYGK